MQFLMTFFRAIAWGLGRNVANDVYRRPGLALGLVLLAGRMFFFMALLIFGLLVPVACAVAILGASGQ